MAINPSDPRFLPAYPPGVAAGVVPGQLGGVELRVHALNGNVTLLDLFALAIAPAVFRVANDDHPEDVRRDAHETWRLAEALIAARPSPPPAPSNGESSPRLVRP